MADPFYSQETVSDRIAFIKAHYPLLGRVSVTGDQIRSVLGRNHVGFCERTEEGYNIRVEGDDAMQGYLTFHEMLHVWLEEQGLTAKISHEDPEIEHFLFCIKNLLNDFFD